MKIVVFAGKIKERLKMFYAFFTLRQRDNIQTKEWMEVSKAEDKSTCIKIAMNKGVILNMIELTKDEFYDLCGLYTPDDK